MHLKVSKCYRIRISTCACVPCASWNPGHAGMPHPALMDACRPRLGGMTGTAFTEAKEFEEVYKLKTVPRHDIGRKPSVAQRPDASGRHPAEPVQERAEGLTEAQASARASIKMTAGSARTRMIKSAAKLRRRSPNPETSMSSGLCGRHRKVEGPA